MKRLVLAIPFLLAFACDPPDPVHDRAVEELGDEIGPANELHRAGQPCATCHNSKNNGPAETDFSIAGTVFASETALVGIDGVRIELVDAVGTSPPKVLTNCVGNFYILRSTWDPVLPVTSVTLTKDHTTRVMRSPIGGTASCADCHQAKATATDPLTKMNAVFLVDPGAPVPATSYCAVNPALVSP